MKAPSISVVSVGRWHAPLHVCPCSPQLHCPGDELSAVLDECLTLGDPDKAALAESPGMLHPGVIPCLPLHQASITVETLHLTLLSCWI